MDRTAKQNGGFYSKIKSLFVNNNLQMPLIFDYPETDSTNTRAKLFAESEDCVRNSHAIFFSRAQSAGRGTRMRSFESPAGAGVYISFLLFLKKSCYDALALTSYAAVAVCRTVEKISHGALSPKIKWVNDVTVNDKKLAGILTEGKITDGALEYAIVGIGVNVSDARHSDEVLKIMTTLEDCGVMVTAEDFAAELSREFFENLHTVGTAPVMNEYRERSSVIGRWVNISTSDGAKEELVRDITTDGSLITEDKSGKVHAYISGDVSIRHI